MCCAVAFLSAFLSAWHEAEMKIISKKENKVTFVSLQFIVSNVTLDITQIVQSLRNQRQVNYGIGTMATTYEKKA